LVVIFHVSPTPSVVSKPPEAILAFWGKTGLLTDAAISLPVQPGWARSHIDGALSFLTLTLNMRYLCGLLHEITIKQPSAAGWA
jgi:hypothetical protein